METRRAAFGFIFVTVLLDMLGFGLIAPVLPQLVAGFVHGNTARAAEAIGLFGTVWAVMQVIFQPVLGALSDRFGRRPVILLSNLGLGVDYLVMALAPSLRWLFLGRALSGITAASIPTATAYITDVTPPARRARNFGLLGAAFGIGFILGPAIGGWLGAQDPRLPFWVAAGCSLANFLYGLLVLPESLPKEKRQPRFAWRGAHPLGSLRLLRSDGKLLGLAGVSFLGYLAHEVYAVVWVLYGAYRYGWGERMLGVSLATVGVTTMVVSATIVGPAVARLGERGALIAGLVLGGVGFALLGWAPNGLLFLLAIPVHALWGISGPTTQSMMTQRVAADEQGELQGAVASLRSLAMLVGPGIFSLIFAFAVAPQRRLSLPGAPWFLAAALLGAAALLARSVTRQGSPAADEIARPLGGTG